MSNEELLEKVSSITYTKYDLKNGLEEVLAIALEELLDTYKHLEEEFIEFNNRVQEDYELKKDRRCDYEQYN